MTVRLRKRNKDSRMRHCEREGKSMSDATFKKERERMDYEM